MNKPDDLEQLWRTQPVEQDVKGEEMRKMILQKTEKFDRTIRRRNMREVVASLAGAIGFSYIAWGQTNWISRLGSALILATFVWIIYYFLRHGSGPADPDPDQSAAGYQRALVSKIDHQIRLVRSAKLWFLLPMYAGLLALSLGGIVGRAAGVNWRDVFGPVIYTVVFAWIWWANDVYAVRKLRQWRTRLESGQGGSLEC